MQRIKQDRKDPGMQGITGMKKNKQDIKDSDNTGRNGDERA